MSLKYQTRLPDGQAGQATETDLTSSKDAQVAPDSLLDRAGPLASVRVVELAGLGPAPYCAMLLADLGADVIRIARPGQPEDPPGPSSAGESGR